MCKKEGGGRCSLPCRGREIWSFKISFSTQLLGIWFLAGVDMHIQLPKHIVALSKVAVAASLGMFFLKKKLQWIYSHVIMLTSAIVVMCQDFQDKLFLQFLFDRTEDITGQNLFSGLGYVYAVYIISVCSPVTCPTGGRWRSWEDWLEVLLLLDMRINLFSRMHPALPTVC